MRNTGEFPRSKREYYGTPGWITRALLMSEAPPDRVWEPCVGDGRMVEPFMPRMNSPTAV